MNPSVAMSLDDFIRDNLNNNLPEDAGLDKNTPPGDSGKWSEYEPGLPLWRKEIDSETVDDASRFEDYPGYLAIWVKDDKHKMILCANPISLEDCV